MRLGYGISVAGNNQRPSGQSAVPPAPFMPNYIYISAGAFMQKYGDSDYRMYKFDPSTGQRTNTDEALWLAYATDPITIGLDTMHQQWYYASGGNQPGDLLDYTEAGTNTGLPTSGWTNGLTIQEYAGPTEVAVSGASQSQYWVIGPLGVQFDAYDVGNQQIDFGQALSHDGTNWVFTSFDSPIGTLSQSFLSGPIGNYTNGIVVSAIV